MKSKKIYKSKYLKIYTKIANMSINEKVFVQFEYNNSSNKFQEAFHYWCKKKYPERFYKTSRLELGNPLILQVWRVK
jgi:hypothetical protein